MNTTAKSLDLLEQCGERLVLEVQPPKRTDTNARTLQLVEALARRLKILPELPGKVATQTFSIGATARDYSTIASWEADLDNGALYSASDDAVGECYDDADFDETVIFNGGGTIGLASATLTVASADRHDGTAGSGARLRCASTFKYIQMTGGNLTRSVEWLEYDANGTGFDTEAFICNSAFQYSDIKNCLVHDVAGTRKGAIVSASGAYYHRFMNNIIYDINKTFATADGVYGVSVGATVNAYALNNTVYNVTNNSGSGYCNGIRVTDSSGVTMQNNIVTDTGGTSTGSLVDYEPASFSSATVDHNLSSDTTAAGTGSLTSKTSANQFVSTVGGSEDLHLKSGADAIDAGTDLGTTPSGVEIDIDGRDRDANADTWDMGADEFVSVGGTTYYPLSAVEFGVGRNAGRIGVIES